MRVEYSSPSKPGKCADVPNGSTFSRKPHGPTLADSIALHARLGGCNVVLTGLLKRENSFSYCLGEIDKSELALMKKVVFSAFIDDSNEVILSCTCVGQDSINLTQYQRRFVSFVLKAQRKLFCRLFHGLSK